jgi:hypothetical protein
MPLRKMSAEISQLSDEVLAELAVVEHQRVRLLELEGVVLDLRAELEVPSNTPDTALVDVIIRLKQSLMPSGGTTHGAESQGQIRKRRIIQRTTRIAALLPLLGGIAEFIH